ncbi:MAG TPA: diacylglycerol kinase family protein [Usitatibacter sp.]|jgi:diacylglycerol kinase family enzyme|nr:diacylglycerol kinase family protein [Usitatibacter sp.]
MKVALVLNEGSGGALPAEALDKVLAAFASAGCEVRRIGAVTGGGLRAAVQEALSGEPDAVVVGGGDGTLGTAAGVLAGTGMPLGVLALGTFNHFAKDLGVPLDLDEAVRTIATGVRTPIDVAEVNGRAFLNNSSLGIYPSIVRSRDQLRGRLRLVRGKLWTFAWAALTALRRAPFLDVNLSLDGGFQRLRAPFLFVGNNAYQMEGFRAGTRNGLRSGKLSVYMTLRRSRLRLVALGLRALFGMLHQARDFEAREAHTLEVHSRHRFILVATDGEVQAIETPLVYRMRPGALIVLLPGAPKG